MIYNNLTIPNYNVEKVYIDGSIVVKNDRIFIKKNNEWNNLTTDISTIIEPNPPIRYRSTCAYCGAPINNEGKCEYCGVGHQYLD